MKAKRVIRILVGWLVGVGLAAAAQPTTQVQFGDHGVSVNEDIGSVDVPIHRDGATNLAFQVDFRTVADGSAVPGVNFTPTNGTAYFAEGVRDVHVRIPILNDGLPDLSWESTLAESTFSVILTNATTGVKIGPDRFVVAIRDLQTPTTLDLSYRFPFDTTSYGLWPAPNGQLSVWDENEFALVNSDDSLTAHRRAPTAFGCRVRIPWSRAIAFASGVMGQPSESIVRTLPPRS
jgi:hypothetical protein